MYGKRSEIDLHVDYVSHQLIRNVFHDPSRVAAWDAFYLSIGFSSADGCIIQTDLSIVYAR